MVSRHKLLVLVTGAVIAVTVAQARDTRLRLPIADALATAEAQSKLDSGVKLYFGDQAHPKPARSFGTVSTNKKTNFFNKTDKEGCEWTFLSAMISLQERARREGGDAVINIKSIYRGGDFSSATEYECGAGALVGGVSFQGEVVKL
ncbi:MAG: excinuclease ABC subunit A [Gammaproteobacteria bacterium]|nr:excinuclease ABC subunit A [Gammaproteobacteria bacterium]